MNSDIVFVVIFGAAAWTTLQLSLGSRKRGQRPSLPQIGQNALMEGLVCAAVWSAINIALSGWPTLEHVGQSLVIGGVWAAFTMIARLPFCVAVTGK